ncbi:hypothetical protein KIH41_17850 [Litoribacter ruber]|uniref:capsule assembly Wzi family protein n=1 Tax=Litoribacter ruber TaxID=702568 RepID=UPI001BD987B5|nr:capsule assembly Wzi family protein [Litoribacter ruber]MBT0813157.1 hypothetical protein [Litoribacter ruber]
MKKNKTYKAEISPRRGTLRNSVKRTLRNSACPPWWVNLFIFIIFPLSLQAQTLPVGFPVLEESLRRAQLLGELDSTVSFTLRPLNPRQLTSYSDTYQVGNLVSEDTLPKSKMQYRFWKERGRVQLLPFHQAIEFNTHHPYPQVNGPMVVNRGFQSYSSVGVYAEIGPLSIQFQPEHIWAQNKSYDIGRSKSIYTEYLERWGDSSYSTFLLGQSSIRLNAGAFSVGASNENIWWGPGQFNSLMFTNNAFGFQHLTLNTRKPAKTFIGSFEGQIIIGRLEGSGLSQRFMHSLVNDWRYVNAILLTYQPKWISGLTLGGTRVFQQYDSFRGDSFADYFPVINPFQKVEAGFDMDADGRDQKASIFLRYAIPKAKTEVYFEYGRRDHAYDWREFVSNPEHARAYLMGFTKLFNLESGNLIQVRGEMLQQQESINILARYPNTTGGGSNWAGHSPVRHGFTHFGQMVGPGIGPSSNIQTLETAWISRNRKLGVRLDRLNRHQDIYVKNFNDATQNGRWVDLNLGLLADWQFGRLFVSSQWYFINSLNYQWRLDPSSTAEFPKGMDVFNFQSTIRAAYVF